MDSLKTSSFYDTWGESFIVDQAGRGKSIDASMSALGRHGSGVGITPTTYRLSNAVSAVRNDETVYAATITKTDAATSKGWYLEGTNKQEKARAQAFLEKAKTDLLLRHLFFNAVPLGNAFVEIVRGPDGRPLPELYVLETTEMEIYDEEGHGVPNKYVQNSSGGQKIEFSPDDVVHFRFDRFTTSLWGEVPLRPLDQLIAIKIKLKNHIWRLFNHNVFRQKINFPKGASDEDVRRSLAEYKLTIKDPDKPYIWFGDDISHDVVMNFEDGPRFLELMTAIDLRILTEMQVPPIMAGIPDSSGRATGEQQMYKAFNTHIRSLQKYVEDTFNFDLLPKLGFKGVKFFFNPIDDKSYTDIIEMAVKLKSMGAKAEKLSEWMSSQGMDLPEDFFDEAFFEAPTKTDKNQLTNSGGAPSRQGKAEGTSSKKIGTGSEGTTRKSQLVTQAVEPVVYRDPTLTPAQRKLLSRGIIP